VLAVAASNAFAQTPAPAPQTSTSLEEVVVTGSFIPTLPEDAAIPVEVINYEDLKNLGRPSNMDLIKTLTETGQAIGELDRQTGYPIDAATVNLRNLGPRFTTVVLNNRRFPEQFSPATGRFNNIASIPNAVIGNVEVLKSGGAAIYGADAVAGVVNYITRKNVTDLEVNANYRQVSDSDGDYDVDAIWGRKFDGGNFMISGAYQHRSKLDRVDRDFTNLSYLENPGGWSTVSSPSSYNFQSSAAGNISPITGTGQRHRGLTGIVRDPACQALGGYSGFSTTGSAVCYSNISLVEPLVEESDQYSLFAEFNQKLGGVDFHLEGLAYYRELPDINVTTRAVPQTYALGGTRNASNLYDRVLFGTTAAYSTSGANPAVGNFMNTYYNQDNTTLAYSDASYCSVTGTARPGGPACASPVGRVGLLNTLWLPFGAGGHPLGNNYDHQENTTTQYRLSGSVGGGVPSFWGFDLEWEVGLTYHYTKDTRWTLDIPTHKLHNALNGFGGPNCAGFAPMVDSTGAAVASPVAAGSAGCYYFNPFSSAFAGNAYTGASNPFFVGGGNFTGYDAGRGLQNNLDMIRWLYEPVTLARYYNNYVVDPILRGTTGIELPGGPVQMAVGAQYRRQDEESRLSDNINRAINPCPRLPNGQYVTAPGLNPLTNQYTASTSDYTGTQNACTGGMAFSKAATVLGTAGNNHRNEKRHYPVVAGFVQFKLPILDNLNADIVGRYEKFYSDVTSIDNDVVVPSIAVKWDITDWVAMRTSWGLTFSQVNPPAADDPVPANGAVPTGVAYTTFDYPNQEVTPEEGENFSVGFIFRSGDFNATVDYNAIKVSGYTRTLTAGTAVTGILMPGEVNTNADALINCSSPLLTQTVGGLGNRPYVELNGACVQGTSRLNSAAGGGGLVGGAVNYFGGTAETNAGDLVSNALDVSMTYSFEAFGGRITPSVNGTYVTKYEFDDWYVQGVKVANGYDGVGYRNSSTGRLGQGVPEYRLGFGVLYRYDRHTVNLTGNYIPSVINEDASDFTATIARNANIGPNTSIGCPTVATYVTYPGSYPAGAGTGEYGTTCQGYNTAILSGTKVASYINLNLLYRVEITDNLDMSVNVVNLLDDDPSYARNQLAYDSGYGSPLGRTIQVSVGAKF
jgi:iron complex outermembrane receptor protein